MRYCGIRRRWALAIGGAATLGLIAPAAAQDEALLADEPAPALPAPAPEPATLTIFWENDGGYYKWNNPTDRYYTNGVGISVAWQPSWADQAAAWLPFADAFGPAQTGFGLMVAQQIFTPGNLAAPIPLPEDRPYAGYLFIGGYLQRQGRMAGVDTLDQFQLDLGIVGPSSLAEDAQVWIHEAFDGEDPGGWDNQLADEPAAQLTVRKKWRLDLVGGNEPEAASQAPPSREAFAGETFGLQLLPEIGGAVGNVHRHIEGGATLRLGWNLPDDFGPGRLNNVASASGRRRLRGLSLYGYARGTGRFVEHNLFLEGSTWDDSLGVDEEPLVGELQLGVMLAYAWDRFQLALGYSQTFITEEFDNQDGSHALGAYTVSMTGWF